MKNQTVLGIMSGTSLDGVDYAWCRISGHGVQLQHHRHVKFPALLGKQLHQTIQGKTNSHETSQLHHDLGRFYARHAQRKGDPVASLCGLHGQTIYHHPNGHRPASFQLGEPSYLATKLRIPVIHNFRAGDLAVGGEGAPLATLFHQEIFGRRKQHICVNNLGGISNVTSIDWRTGQNPHVLSFDTGPANMLLDLAVKHYSRGTRTMDKNGVLAAQGSARQQLLSAWLKHPYYKRRPPKSTGGEMFGEDYWQKIHTEFTRSGTSQKDALATLTELSARSMAMQYRNLLPSLPHRVILTGGGAANSTLVAAVEQAMTETVGPLPDPIEIITSLDLGWPYDCVEPAAFALLAWKRWHRLPGHLPSTTGAREKVFLGQITEV